MLDPKFIIENLELIKEGARKKNVDVDIDRFVVLNQEKKEIQQIIDDKRAEQNKASAKIAQLDNEEKQEAIEAVSGLKKEIQEFEDKIKDVEIEWADLLMSIPNPPSPKMPEGKDDEDNTTVHAWGEKPEFDFEPKDHMELGTALDIVDVEKAAEISGSRFYYLKGDAVRMQFAIVQFVFDTVANGEVLKKIINDRDLNLSYKTFVPIIPPVMIRHDVQYAIHRVFGDQTYQFKEDGLNLVASAEHTLAPYHMNETLKEDELPKRYIGYSTAFRREAGTYGKDMGGILRTHQFDKLEMESFTTAETGEDEQELIVGIQEYLVQQLEVPYRLQQVCTGDTGRPDYQQFDIECWIPSQNTYRETHTSDYMTDYQTRGINSKYKTKDGKNKFLHTNDATAFAIGRILIAIWENNQAKDGRIKIPKVLQKYMGGQEYIG